MYLFIFSFYDKLVDHFSNTEFYLKHVSKWPYPFNDVSMMTFIVLVVSVVTVYSALRDHKFANRLRRNQQIRRIREEEAKIREIERDEREQKRFEREMEENRLKREDNELMNQYMKFIMMAQMQNISSMSGLSFEEYKNMKIKSEAREKENKVETKVVEKIVEKEIPVEIVKEVKVEVPVEVIKEVEIVKEIPVEVEVIKEDPLAYIDELTGLGNLRAYKKALEKANVNNMSVVYFDVNNLKTVNDTMGHSAGDTLITTVANALNKIFESSVFRTGGDEFVAVLGIKSEGTVERMVKAFQNALANATMESTDGICYETACGFCTSKKGLTKENIVKIAEDRMYENKAELKKLKKDSLKESNNVKEIEDNVEDNTEINKQNENLWNIQEEALDYVKSDNTTNLVELEEEDFYIPQNIENMQVNEEEEEEIESESIVNLSEIVSHKMEDNNNLVLDDEEIINQFTSLLHQVEENQEAQKKIENINIEREKIKNNNINVLDKKLKRNFVVDGKKENYNDDSTKELLQADFDSRKAKVLKQEEKERVKAEKKAEKLAKKEAKKKENGEKKRFFGKKAL